MKLVSSARVALGAFTALVIWACASAPPGYPSLPRAVVIDEIVAQTMFEIQREYEVETIRCLVGYVANDTVFVETMAPTWINSQTPTNASFKACMMPGTVGYYHNHPIQPSMGAVCWHSKPDIYTLDNHRNFWVSIITCDNMQTLAWRFKQDTTTYYWPPRS